jgi:hypothetical protein
LYIVRITAKILYSGRAGGYNTLYIAHITAKILYSVRAGGYNTMYTQQKRYYTQ